jgi:hypothetical protein
MKLPKKILLVIIAQIVISSCDVVKEDAVKISPLEENTGTIFYTLPDADLSINPAAFDKLKYSKLFIISQLPKFGEAKFVENGNVFYRANANTTFTQDAFTLEGTDANGAKVSQEIQVNLVTTASNLPCSAGAIGDKNKADAEVASEIDVLANDKTCSKIQDNSLKIEIAPKHGKAEIINRRAVYTPEKDYLGEDLFFYKIGINNTKNPVAPVEISVAESRECTQSLTDDAVNFLTYSLGSEIQLDVLANDKPCDRYKNTELRILTNPKIGSVRIENKKIFYKTNTAIKGTETFEYALFRSEKLYIKAKVMVNFE